MIAIVPGDLVAVVRGGHVCDLGHTFHVESIYSDDYGWYCEKCGTAFQLTGKMTAYADRGDGYVYPVSWLLKIEPPALESDTQAEREMHLQR